MAQVIVVEDEIANRKFMSIWLKNHGIGVLEAETAAQARTIVRESDPDAMILDIGLPDADGLDLLREFRAVSATSRLPIIVVSAYTQDDEIESIMAGGATAYISKPFDPQLLVDTVRQCLADAGVAG